MEATYKRTKSNLGQAFGVSPAPCVASEVAHVREKRLVAERFHRNYSRKAMEARCSTKRTRKQLTRSMLICHFDSVSSNETFNWTRQINKKVGRGLVTFQGKSPEGIESNANLAVSISTSSPEQIFLDKESSELSARTSLNA